MASTVFVDTVTHIPAAWANDVNTLVYDIFQGAQTVGQARAALGFSTMAYQPADNVQIAGGTINNVVIGYAAANLAQFTEVRLLSPILDLQQATTKAYVDTLFASAPVSGKYDKIGGPISGPITQPWGYFSTTADSLSGQYILRATTTNATVTEMFLPTGGRLVLPDDATWKFQVEVVARRTDINDESLALNFKGCVDRNTGAGTIALVGPVTQETVAQDSPAWAVTVDADVINGSLRLRVQGELGKTIRWMAFVRTVEVSG